MHVQEVLAKDRRRTLLMSSRSRTITASRRASAGLVRGNSLNSSASKTIAVPNALSPRGWQESTDTRATAASAAAHEAPFPEFEDGVAVQMPPLAVSPSGDVCVQACSPKQVLLDVAKAEGVPPQPQTEADAPWRHLLHGELQAAGGPGAGEAGEVRAGAGGGDPRRRRVAAAFAVKVPPRRELTPPRRGGSPPPTAQALREVAETRPGFAARARAEGAAPPEACTAEWSCSGLSLCWAAAAVLG